MSDAKSVISLVDAREPTIISVRDVYFAFANGRLVYDCIACGAKCCRGYGYMSAPPEMQLQLRMRRHLPVFVTAEADSAGTFVVRNSAPGCFFLTTDGLCEIQSEHGFDAKPETCRLFPFNNLRRLGNYLIVRPHLVLCPLTTAPPGTASACSDYSAIMNAMRSRGIAAHVPKCSFSGGDSAGEDVATERQIVSLSEQFLEHSDYFDFVRAQLTVNASSTDGALADDSERDLDCVLRLLRDLFDIPSYPEQGSDPELVRTMTALTPYLRSEFVFHDLHNRRPHNYLPLEPAKVPLAMACIFLFARAARHAGMKSVTLQTIAKIAKDLRPLAALLPYAGSVMAWRGGVPIELAGFGEPELRTAFFKLAKALLPSSQRRHPMTLGDAFREYAPADTVTRILFAKGAARHLAGSLVPLGQEALVRRDVPMRERLAATARRLALANGDEQFLELLYNRLHRHRRARP